MKLTVLGCYGPYPPAGGACSGYLLEHDNFRVLLDCGNGVISKLQQFIHINHLDGVIVSHLHSDHTSDLFILRYALQIFREKGERTDPLPLYVPCEPKEDFNRLPYKNVYSIDIITEKLKLHMGPFQFSFIKTIHPVDCYAIAVYLEGEKIIVYSADTEYFPVLNEFARGASLFLCEANYLDEDLEKGAVNHLSASQAASIAYEAKVKKLLLTHLPPHRNPELYLEEAKGLFSAVELAREGIVYELNKGSLSKDNNEERGWAQLKIETDPVRASLLEGRLKEEGIPVFLKNDEAAGRIYGLTVGPLAQINILVPFSYLERAKKVVFEIEGNNEID